MGVYLSTANTEKTSEHGGHSAETDTRYGLTSMQGWRQTMEDAHMACPEVQELQAILGREIGLYGVFDGHGGPAVSAWIAKHMIRVLEQEVKSRKSQPVPVAETHPQSSSSDGNVQQFDEDVILLSESLCKTFIQLDEEMQKPEHLEELRVINEYLQAKSVPDESRSGDGSGGDSASSSIKSLLSSQPRSFLQAFLNNTRPVIKLIEQDGEQFFQLSSNGNGEEGEGAPQTNATVEEIVEDSHVTAPETKSPRLAQVVAEHVVAGSVEPKANISEAESPSPTAAVIQTAVKHLSDAKEGAAASVPKSGAEPTDAEVEGSEEEAGASPTVGELHPQLSVDEMQMRPGIPETCGAAVVVCAVVGGEKPLLITANAGDSRCVLSRKGVAIAQSHDHKPYLIHEMNRIQQAGGYLEHGRVDGNLNLSRTLGDLFYKRNKALKPEEQKITAYPDIIVTPITPDDEFVILACDGIWDCMTNQQACDFVSSRLGEEPTPEHLSKICEDMCDSCLAGHPMESDGGIGCDNMTCIIVMLNDRYRKKGIVGEASATYYQKSSA